jgi:aspartyl-tRNA(Asn)/glutamyl-tRNA(Gln) amidotransferase subunit A
MNHMSNQLINLSLKEARKGLLSKEFSSEELTSAYLSRIDAHDKTIQAYITTTPDYALAQAKKADELYASGDGEKYPLLGIPMGVKDVLAVDGVRTTGGSKILENFKPPYTGTAVNKLFNAGMVMLGKTNTDEFAMGSSTENSAFQTTKNPWNIEHVPGGSSGGSAAAVSAKLALAALGTDTGGSVRQPAAFCGLTGLKTTYGRVSRYGLFAYGSSLDTIGALGNSAEDVSTIFEVMAGVDKKDSTTLDMPVPKNYLSDLPDLKGVRIGVPAEFFIEGMQASVESAVNTAIDEMKSLGAEIVEISLPHTKYALPVYYLIAPAEASANLARLDGVRYGYRAETEDMFDLYKQSRGTGFGSEVKRRIMLGTYALSAGYYDAYYGQAQKVRTLIQRDYLQAFEKVDIIATPVTPSTAFKIGEHNNDPISMYLEDVFTLPANLAGVPGLAFSVGFDEKKMPIGMQLMGKHFGEASLLNTVHNYQQVTDWHKKIPTLS